MTTEQDKAVALADKVMDAVRTYGYVRQQYGEEASTAEFTRIRAHIESMQAKLEHERSMFDHLNQSAGENERKLEQALSRVVELEKSVVRWEPISDPDFSKFYKWQEIPSDNEYIYHRAIDMTWLRLKKPAGCYVSATMKGQQP